MDIDLPSLAAGQHRASLEEELGAVFAGLLADSKGAKDVVADIHEVCARRAEALRLEAAEQLHRPARHMALKAVADEMEAQAATWQLLFCLHCDEAAPAGEGGSVVRDAGGALLYRQRLADAVASEPELARCARVVAWLESLAEEAQRRGGGGGAGGGGGGAGGGGGGASFQPLEALWYETKTEMRAGTGSVVSELDPDAPSRTGRPLHPGNARSQERLMGRVWQLLRAGKTPEVLELCAAVGQPWRAAALGGGGPWGALPVGAAAAEADEAVGEDVQAEELADEVSNGAGTLLALWRWAALQAASGGGGGGADGAFRLERAVFGELGDSAAAAAPACGTWEDFAWSYCSYPLLPNISCLNPVISILRRAVPHIPPPTDFTS
ncbi:hypothetical protein CHLRE_10g425675v5 [Chlamydomonas reinhardtii]|uniref:Nuclear pore complex protein n=1 Tax=Chlamydomonas reinhardtii TaxID=3055 RepID=A0A2K3D9H2_CHLRE|nr:uncharacterized protein CHLRE_10g425675v5 [Chlamydomonas reinhardtii]PNW77180.1 hypothetical protein CHLRE_10g425675v5 [Chlamydomonas reinhardtii]